MQTGRELSISTIHNRSLRAPLRSAFGFTLLELVVVIAIISILLGMAAGRYERSLQQSREAVLKQDLRVLNDAIQQYTLDKMAGPQSLDDLKTAGYIGDIPVDPMTQRKDWVAEFGDVLLTVDETTPGITAVHSASQSISPFDGKPYSSW